MGRYPTPCSLYFNDIFHKKTHRIQAVGPYKIFNLMNFIINVILQIKLLPVLLLIFTMHKCCTKYILYTHYELYIKR